MNICTPRDNKATQRQPGEDHRFVCAGSECLADGEEEHGPEQRRCSGGGSEQQEAHDVGRERDQHRAPPAPHIGHGAGWNLQEVHGRFPERDEQADDEKTQALVQEHEDQERFEVALVFEKAVEAKSKEH